MLREALLAGGAGPGSSAERAGRAAVGLRELEVPAGHHAGLDGTGGPRESCGVPGGCARGVCHCLCEETRCRLTLAAPAVKPLAAPAVKCGGG